MHTHLRGTAERTYAEHLATGLVQYANVHAPFADWLSRRVQESSLFHSSPGGGKACVATLVPRSEYQACERAEWLIGMAERHAIDGHEMVGQTLSGFAHVREREAPKAIVLGIEIGVIPVGLMGKMKMRREPMHIIVREDLLTTGDQMYLMKTVTMLTHRIVERALIDAQGTTAHLEPEIGDWLFGDKQLSLFGAGPDALRTLGAYLEVNQLPYSSHSDAVGYTVIVLSPVLHSQNLPGYEQFSSVDS